MPKRPQRIVTKKVVERGWMLIRRGRPWSSIGFIYKTKRSAQETVALYERHRFGLTIVPVTRTTTYSPPKGGPR